MRSLDLKRSKLWMTAGNAECFSSTYKFEENNKTLDIRDVDESTRVKHTVKISQKITKMMWNQPLLPRHIQPILELMLHCQDQPTKQISIYFSFRQVITNQKATSTSITKEVRGKSINQSTSRLLNSIRYRICLDFVQRYDGHSTLKIPIFQ